MRSIFLFVFAARLCAAQAMDHSHMPGMQMPGMQMDDVEHGSGPHYASGTSVNPASSPMNMIHVPKGNWTFMFHGLVFLTETQQTGPRGRDKFASMNWFMAEAAHPLGKGEFAVRSMLSLDPATVTGRQYPLLFQTGETAYGKPIVDGQHPHNLFMELSLRYSYPLASKVKAFVYFAPVGDPALGPVAFPHRVSAAELPQATLSHHLQDSTHIAYEVITAGVTHGIFGLEASGFHGAEPNENRWNIGHGTVDSYSARFTVSPTANWSGQVSAGHLTHPEELEPGDQTRATASATYNRPYAGGEWATSLLWGRVHKIATQANLNGYGLESVARFAGKNYVTGRIELVDKDELFAEGQPLAGRVFRIGAYTAGYTRDFYFLPRIATGLGANFTLYSKPAALRPYYGDRPVGVMIYLRFKLRSAS